MLKEQKIRPLALVIIKHQDGVLVTGPHHDALKKQNFFRAVGGGVEFGEKAITALKRELKEELDAELINIKYLGVLENVFNFEGRDGHEICFIYQADFKDKKLYNIKQFKILDSKKVDGIAKWVRISDLKKSIFYPDGIKGLI